MKSNSYKFAVIGGDKRQLFLIASLLSDGYSVLAGGFDSLSGSGDISFVSVEQAIAHSDIIILPLPAVCADGSLNAPFDSEKIIFSEDVQTMLRSKLVFAGMSDRLVRSYPQLSGAKFYDYSLKEEFAVLNSVPTAEGALALAMQKSERTIWGSKIMIIGYGRIGKSLSRLASSMGAAVTVCARGSGDRAAAQTLGYEVLDTSSLHELRDFDFIFNTVPAMLLDKKLLSCTDQSSIVLDLASLPGGVDFEAAKRLGIDAFRALALPGKYAPKTAAEIIKSVVLDILRENKA